jgi:hypothetical protein
MTYSRFAVVPGASQRPDRLACGSANRIPPLPFNTDKNAGDCMNKKTSITLQRWALAFTLAIGAAQAMAAGALAIDSNQGNQYGFAYNQSSPG